MPQQPQQFIAPPPEKNGVIQVGLPLVFGIPGHIAPLTGLPLLLRGMNLLFWQEDFAVLELEWFETDEHGGPVRIGDKGEELSIRRGRFAIVEEADGSWTKGFELEDSQPAAPDAGVALQTVQNNESTEDEQHDQ